MTRPAPGNAHLGGVLVDVEEQGVKAAVPERNVYVVPDDMDPRVAAGIPVEFATADDCLFEFGGLRAGETVLVQAAAGPLTRPTGGAPSLRSAHGPVSFPS